jgi:hypothetical protein
MYEYISIQERLMVSLSRTAYTPSIVRAVQDAQQAIASGTSDAWHASPNRNTFTLFVDEVERRLRKAQVPRRYFPPVDALRRENKGLRLPAMRLGQHLPNVPLPHPGQLVHQFMKGSETMPGLLLTPPGLPRPRRSAFLETYSVAHRFVHGSQADHLFMVQPGPVVNPSVVKDEFGLGLYMAPFWETRKAAYQAKYGPHEYSLPFTGHMLNTAFLKQLPRVMGHPAWNSLRQDAIALLEKWQAFIQAHLLHHESRPFKQGKLQELQTILQMLQKSPASVTGTNIQQAFETPVELQPAFLKAEGFSGWKYGGYRPYQQRVISYEGGQVPLKVFQHL